MVCKKCPKIEEHNLSSPSRDDYFLITQDLDLPLLPSDSFIHVTCNITNSTGGNIQQGKVALCHNGFNLFQRALYLLNEQIIEDVDELGIATTVKGFIDYSRSFSKTLDSELWIPDEGLGGNNDSSVTNFRTLTAIRTTLNAGGADNTSFNVTVVTNAGLITLAESTGTGTAVATGDTVVLYLDGSPLTCVRYTVKIYMYFRFHHNIQWEEHRMFVILCYYKICK